MSPQRVVVLKIENVTPEAYHTLQILRFATIPKLE